MSRPIIEVSSLSKRYHLGAIGATRLRDDIEYFWQRLKGEKEPPEKSDFWALKDISFTVQPGEVVGIIGRNGAGKSTLLKILSRITEPTKGEVVLRGRIASLLEVGTGFHPDLTGRENAYLNGAIMGMTRAEVRSKLDEIVAFAEVEQFLDTPVKHYSSGMYVRLAFAVAAHLDPEILIVDEVLAVGDAQFQARCLGKMQDVSRKHGRTVLFVSHNLAAISQLTQKCVYLASGSLSMIGPTRVVLDQYLDSSFERHSGWTAARLNRNAIQITQVAIRDAQNRLVAEIEAIDGFTIELKYEVRKSIRNGVVEVYVMASDGAHLVTLGEHDATPGVLSERLPGVYNCRIPFPGGWLGLGRYFVRINSSEGDLQTFDSEDTVAFSVMETRSRSCRENRQGYLVPMIRWQTTFLGAHE